MKIFMLCMFTSLLSIWQHGVLLNKNNSPLMYMI